jgi:hypothetical protein
MKKLSITLCVALAATLSMAAFAQDVAGQGASPDAAAGATPGQVSGAGSGASGGGGGPGAVFNTTLTARSHTIAANGSEGNLEGTACTAPAKMISGACHPFYNPNVVIINQFPNIGANTWRCGFKNNTAASVSVWIYTVCAQ